jgi:hypothetical protein
MKGEGARAARPRRRVRSGGRSRSGVRSRSGGRRHGGRATSAAGAQAHVHPVLRYPRWRRRMLISKEHGAYPMLAAQAAAQWIQAIVRGRRARALLSRFGPRGEAAALEHRFHSKYAAFVRRYRQPPGAASLLLFGVVKLQAWWRMISVRWFWRRHPSAVL